MEKLNEALRYNEGKLRYNLIPENAKRELARVYTLGAHKYSTYLTPDGKEVKGSEIPFAQASGLKKIYDGANNWRLGLKWSDVMESAMRHIEAYKRGEDFDELGTYHLSNAVWNLMTILEYYHIHPELDDRMSKYKNIPRIGLDIDDVLADFCGAYADKYGLDEPKSWLWSYKMKNNMADKNEWADFLSCLPRKIEPNEIPFEPCCYVTSRCVDSSITEGWIERNGFPCSPVITVGHDESKVEALKKAGVEIFVDDRYDTFVELNANGICCYLMDAPHNRRYDVGYRRIYKLSDLPFFEK